MVTTFQEQVLESLVSVSTNEGIVFAHAQTHACFTFLHLAAQSLATCTVIQF